MLDNVAVTAFSEASFVLLVVAMLLRRLMLRYITNLL